MQDAFITAFRLDQFDYSSTFGAWLKRIVINKSIDLLRRRKLTVIDIDEASIGGTLEEETIDEESWDLKVESVKKAMIQLPSPILPFTLTSTRVSLQIMISALPMDHLTTRLYFLSSARVMIKITVMARDSITGIVEHQAAAQPRSVSPAVLARSLRGMI